MDSGCVAGEGARPTSEGGGWWGSQWVTTGSPSVRAKGVTRCPDDASVRSPARPASSSLAAGDPAGVSGRFRADAEAGACGCPEPERGGAGSPAAPGDQARARRYCARLSGPPVTAGWTCGPTPGPGGRGQGSCVTGGWAGAPLPRGSVTCRRPSGLSGHALQGEAATPDPRADRKHF